MARLEQLVEGVQDEKLRRQIEAEITALKERTRFGLVYERHLPETALIADRDLVEIGSLVRPKKDVDKDTTYRVIGFKGKKTARLTVDGNGKELEVPISELFVVKPFGEAIYPSLTPVDTIEHGGERPYHAVINGENFHALQLLAYTYEGQVDCLYLDPPYNSGSADWRYNNRYVDATDSYRHSKWLSMMEKRLRIGKRLLKPDGVVIITIDENEVHHLGVLLEEIFPEYQRTLITIVINPKGTGAANFARVEEYAFFLVPESAGDDRVPRMPISFGVPWDARRDHRVIEVPAEAENGETDTSGGSFFRKLALRRDGAESSNRRDRPRQFYAIYVNEKTHAIGGIGPELGPEDDVDLSAPGGFVAVYPVDPSGRHRVWRYGRQTMVRLIESGEIRVGRHDAKKDTYSLYHWKPIDSSEADTRQPRTVWWHSSHDAGAHGSSLLNMLLGERSVFPFPKSLYAVRDCLQLAVGDHPEALVVDFFAGSGTTLHATALLNSEDAGRRRCILVTNNEVDPKRTRKLNREGFYRGDPEFEAEGIFEAATMPRIKAAFTGKRPDGTPFPDEKKFSYIDGRLFSAGFDENAVFFRLDYLNADAIELGEAFDAIHPLLWLAAGGRGPRPGALDAPSKDFFISEQGGYAVLFTDAALRDLEEDLAARDDITHLYVITDSPDAYAEAVEALGRGRTTSMLYRDYLRNFRINTPQFV